MKKTLLSTLSLVLITTLAACGTSTPTNRALTEPVITTDAHDQSTTVPGKADVRSGLTAQGWTTTYTKLADWNKSFVVPAGVHRVYFMAPYYSTPSNPGSNNSAAVTPGTTVSCNAALLGWENATYSCYSATETEPNYDTQSIEFFNRWDNSYSGSYRNLWLKLQVTNMGYARSDTSEYLRFGIGYVPSGTEVQVARNWLVQNGWTGSKILTDAYNKVAYAVYAYATAPNTFGYTGGLRAYPFDPAGPQRTVIVQ